MQEVVVYCNDCNKRLEKIFANEKVNDNCPFCGSINKYVELTISEFAQAHDCLKIIEKVPGIKKPATEMIIGDDLCKKENKWVSKNRVINRKGNNYYEKIVDKESNEIIHECSEKLTDHYGHGSAKKK